MVQNTVQTVEFDKESSSVCFQTPDERVGGIAGEGLQ